MSILIFINKRASRRLRWWQSGQQPHFLAVTIDVTGSVLFIWRVLYEADYGHGRHVDVAMPICDEGTDESGVIPAFVLNLSGIA